MDDIFELANHFLAGFNYLFYLFIRVNVETIEGSCIWVHSIGLKTVLYFYKSFIIKGIRATRWSVYTNVMTKWHRKRRNDACRQSVYYLSWNLRIDTHITTKWSVLYVNSLRYILDCRLACIKNWVGNIVKSRWCDLSSHGDVFSRNFSPFLVKIYD